MTSKTFKSAATNRTLTVEGFFNGAFSVVFSDDSSRDLMLQGDDAPALALAILEAAGVVPTQHSDSVDEGSQETLEDVMHWLTRHVRSAEAKAELEAEALELYKAHTSYHHAKSLSEAASPSRWLAVARKAREIGAKK